MKLLLIPFPQISSYFIKVASLNELLAFLKKLHYSQGFWLAKQKCHGIHQSFCGQKCLPHLFLCSLLYRAPEVGLGHKGKRVEHGGDMLLIQTQ